MTLTKPMTAEMARYAEYNYKGIDDRDFAVRDSLKAIASGQHTVIEARELERLHMLDATHAAICQGLITAEFMEGEEDDVLAVFGTFIDHHKSKEAEIVSLRAENEALRNERDEEIRRRGGAAIDAAIAKEGGLDE